MKHEVMAEYTEELVKSAARRCLMKSLGWDYGVVWLVMLAGLVVLLCRGERGWFVGAVGAVLVIAAFVAITGWVVMQRRALGALRRMGGSKVTWGFDDDGITVTSDVSSGSFKWQVIQKLWCFPEVWLLFVGKGAYSTLPTAGLTDEARRFIVAKLKEHGARVSQ